MKSNPKLGIWPMVIGLILAAGLLASYAYFNKVKDDIALTGKAEMDVLSGEVYRLRQNIDQQSAKMGYLLDPRFERYLAQGEDSTYVWLFYRRADSAWYAEVSGATRLDETHQYRLYLANVRDTMHVGAFERISDTVGLQRVGKAPVTAEIVITGAHRDVTPAISNEMVLYRAKL